MGDVIEVSWADSLEEEGILRRGFGSIPKYAMLDPNLSITAKAVYAYLCACAGSGTTTYPGRDTIVYHLGINKDTYHKYSKELRESGYISVRKAALRPGQAHKFTHNIYTIESYPKRFSEDPRYQCSDAGDTISVNGIRAAGYGMIPRMVMEDRRISAKAKALYAYLAGYTGGGKAAFPEIKKTLYHLHISRNTYFTLMKELVGVNYVEAVQRHVNGRLSVNDYYLVSNPSLANAGARQRKVAVAPPGPEERDTKRPQGAPARARDKLQSPQADMSALAADILHHYSQADVSALLSELLRKIPQPGAALQSAKQSTRQSTNFSDTGNQAESAASETLAGEALNQYPKISDTGKQDIEIQDSGKQDTEEQDAGKQDAQKPDSIINNTTINSLSINSISKINPFYQQGGPPLTPLCDWFDTMDRLDIEQEI